jgi:CRP/FNR family cyclic AMP-dependent transcriptional regulator
MRKVLFIFGELTDADVDWLAKAGERVQLSAGTVLIPVGTRVDHLFILLDGQLVIKAANGTFIAKLESGEVVGEMSLVDPAPTAVSVEVAVDSLLFRVPDVKLREKLASDSGFAARFYRAICIFLADRLRATTRRMGYGSQDEIDSAAARGELNENVMETMHLAGARFARMLQKMLAS